MVWDNAPQKTRRTLAYANKLAYTRDNREVVMDERDDPLNQTVPLVTALTRARQHEPVKAVLLVQSIEGVRVVALGHDRRLVIGRDPSAGLFIDDAGLSRRHARFFNREGEVWVEDLGSTNGTALRGERVEAALQLQPGDEVHLGPVIVTLHLAGGEARASAGGATLLGHDRFLASLEREVARCRAFERRCSLLMLTLPREREGQPESVRHALHPLDVFAAYGPGCVEVLLLERDLASACELGRRLLAADDAVRCAVAAFPEAGTSSDELLQRARDGLRQASDTSPLQQVRPYANPDLAAAPGESASPDASAPVVVSEAMQRTHETIERLAGTIVSVLLLGETGTGKEVLARAIHQVDGRREHRMVPVNCGAIPPTLLESVLFGHEKGAFTGADQRRAGLFEEADGGTLFLDEIGELSASAQAALLRVLETRKVTRVGGRDERPVNVRIIAATHRDLEQMAQTGQFRSDLLYRINTMTLSLPPLRERLEEIDPLARRFVAEASAANGCAVDGVAPGALRRLLRYSWPGNVRELRNVVERAVILCRDRPVDETALPARVLGDDRAAPSRPSTLASTPASTSSPATGGDGNEPTLQFAATPTLLASGMPIDLRELLKHHESELILAALEQTQGNRSEAARLLSIPLRTLSHKMRQLGIKRGGFVSSP
jgi:DNA-binding NtrC family response regulator